MAKQGNNAGDIDPAVSAQLDKIKAQADAINKESASEMLTAIIKEVKPDASSNQVKLIVMEEFDKNFSRQPKLSADGSKLTRVNKKGETLEINADYLRERYADIIPAEKKSAGQLELELARESLNSLTLQSKLVEMVGTSAAEKLLVLVGGPAAGVGKLVEPLSARPRPGSNGKVTADNPWSFPPGDKEGDELRADYIRKFGAKASVAKARELNVDLAGRPMRKAGA